jgi:hypothetical protein
MRPENLPHATVYDPSEDPPSSVDPMGTDATAEQLAEILFPALTNRMWRARLLTFSVVAARLAEQAYPIREDNQTDSLELRLALERFFVSALARAERTSELGRTDTRNVPGIRLARLALQREEPLEPWNFLKGQATNGSQGVMARLARDLEILDEEEGLGTQGRTLLDVWSSEQGLFGILGDNGSSSPGTAWLRRLRQRISECLTDSSRWPSGSWSGWSELVTNLQPSATGRRERRMLYESIVDPENWTTC